jgi:peptide deformylase
MRRGRLLVLAVAAVACGCAQGPRPSEPVSRPTRLHAEQVLSIMRGGGEAPMELVLNDSEAGDDFLHVVSAPVDPGDAVVSHLVKRMLATVHAEKGVGIAAPQVGIARRVILVKRVDKEPEQPFEAYLNAEISGMSDEKETDWEGCLSVPAGFGKVPRSTSVTVEYDDLHGEHVTEEVEGYTARIFQHEIDHLDGVLFVERMEVVELMPEEEYRAMKEAQEGE